MIPNLACPSCGASAKQAWPGIIAPFIAEYVLRGPVAACRLMECEICQHRYFDQVFSEPELERLYAGYRGPAYFEVRHRHEPWYTETYNSGIGHAPVRVAARKAALSSFLHSSGLKAPLGKVLDFGGDSGQLIPEAWAQERFVHDMSDASAIEGVEKLGRETDLEGRAFDLILLSHVLEHVPDLIGLLTQVRRLLPPGGGHIYLEVPLERPWTGFLGRGRGISWFLARLCRQPRLLRLVDFYSSAFRVKAGFYPPLGFPKLHEHLHFFTPESLQKLLARAGLKTSNLQKVSSVGKGRSDALACLAEPMSRD